MQYLRESELVSPLNPIIITPTENEFSDVAGMIQSILENDEYQESGIVKVVFSMH